MAYISYIQDEEHYKKVIEKVTSVKKSLWIGTADIKDLHVKSGNSSVPFLSVLADLLKMGVEIRLIHAKEPGPIFREEFDSVWAGFRCKDCSRKKFCGDPIV